MKKIIGMLVILVAAVGGYFYLNSEKDVKNSGEKIMVTHSKGTTEVLKNPGKVVVFDYGILDTLRKINVEPAGLPKETIPTYLSQYADKRYGDVGSLKEPNLEKIYEIKPDLIIISGRQEPFYDQLSKIAPTLYLPTNSGDYMKGFKENMTAVGKVFDREGFISKEVARIEKKMDELKSKVTEKGSTAIVTLSNSGKLSAYGENSRFGIIHRYFGFKTADSIEGGTHGSKIAPEYLLEKNPEYIFVVDRNAAVGGEVTGNKTFDNPIIGATQAAQNKKLIFLDAEVWYNSTGGLESTEKMVDEVTKAVK